MKKFYNKYTEHLINIRAHISEYEYNSCRRMSTDLIRHSLFFEYEVGLWIGEFLESLFSDIISINDYYEIDQNDQKAVEHYLYMVIDYLTKNIPIKTKNQKIELVNIFSETRYNITKFQISYARDKEPIKSQSDFPGMIFREPPT